MQHLLMETETWVALAFVLFVGGLGYIGVHRMLAKSLDERAARIKAELDSARALREEAEQLLAAYRRKRGEADREAEEIVASAKAEAERIAAEAHAKLEEFVERRTALAQSKIAQAEREALADVRAAAAEAAVAAAARVLADTAKGKVADDLIDQGIRDIKAKLN